MSSDEMKKFSRRIIEKIRKSLKDYVLANLRSILKKQKFHLNFSNKFDENFVKVIYIFDNHIKL